MSNEAIRLTNVSINDLPLEETNGLFRVSKSRAEPIYERPGMATRLMSIPEEFIIILEPKNRCAVDSHVLFGLGKAILPPEDSIGRVVTIKGNDLDRPWETYSTLCYLKHMDEHEDRPLSAERLIFHVSESKVVTNEQLLPKKALMLNNKDLAYLDHLLDTAVEKMRRSEKDHNLKRAERILKLVDEAYNS
jgi:hypothetical protein